MIRNAHILICCQVQTNLSAPTVHAHSLLSTSSSSVLVLMILALNILSLPLWSNNNIVQDCWRMCHPLFYQRNSFLQQVIMLLISFYGTYIASIYPTFNTVLICINCLFFYYLQYLSYTPWIALNGLLCAEVLLRNYSLTHSLYSTPIPRMQAPASPKFFGTFYMHAHSMRNNNQVLLGD